MSKVIEQLNQIHDNILKHTVSQLSLEWCMIASFYQSITIQKKLCEMRTFDDSARAIQLGGKASLLQKL